MKSKKEHKDIKQKIVLVGDYNWKQMRDLLLASLLDCKREREFLKIIYAIHRCTGKKKELIKQRKKMDIKPFTKQELKRMM